MCQIDPEAVAEKFKERFEGEDIMESVVLCNNCNEELEEHL